MTELDEDRLPGSSQPAAAPDEPRRAAPAGDPAAMEARLRHDPVCTSYG